MEQTVRYINDHDAFVAEEAGLYLVRKARYINYQLWAIEESRKRYVVLESTPGEHRTRRAIADSLQNDAKKVTIHLLKDGQPFEGKIAASTLRNTRDYSYSSWNLDAGDRNRFEELYSRGESILPRDILKITYGKKTLYEQG